MVTLKKGAKGEDVKTLQIQLNKFGYNIKVDGDFGKITDEKVRDFQKKNKLTVDGVVGPKTWKVLLSINEPPQKVAKVTFAANLSEYRKGVVDLRTIRLHEDIGTKTKNYNPVFSSTIRSPEEQATAMYDNEKNNKSVAYAEPGRQVIAIYKANTSMPKADVIKLMVSKIIELANQGKRVSLHCVPEGIYSQQNIIDISPASLQNKIDYVKEAVARKEITRIITPWGNKSKDYNNNPKVSVDTNEPAGHFEHKF